MIRIKIKLNEGILNWLRKKKIKFSLTETGLDIEPKFEAVFKETWMFEHVVGVSTRGLRHGETASSISVKLNEGSWSGRGQKFEGRQEIVMWCHENGMKFKFEYEMGKRVKAVCFTKEEHAALFLLTWG